MRVLIADKFPSEGVESLRALDLDVVLDPDLQAADLARALNESGASVLVVRSTRVEADCFDDAAALSLVIRAGAGVNTIDLAAASRRGVFVANCPGKNAIAVAELVIGLILSLDRGIADAVAEMRAGSWDKKRFGKGNGLYGRRLGLVGFGAIAREVAQRALGLGMQVSAWSRTLDATTARAHDVERAGGLDELLAASDVVSLHVPYSQQTHHLIGAAELARMKPGALLIHTARGGVVDDAALGEAVSAGRLKAGLDVYEDEPAAGQAPFTSPLREVAGVHGTPHIGASTAQAESATADEVIRIVRDYARLGVVHNAVNVLADRPARCTLVVRHLDRIGVLAGVLGALSEEHVNVQEMHNVVFSGNDTACATITLQRQPPPALLARLRASPDILAAEIRAVGSASP